MRSSEQIAWTRDVLERIFDLAFLQRCLSTAPDGRTFDSARELQTTLMSLIEQLKPTNDVPASSLAWRVYNALANRYVRGLTQAEAAAELNISARQLRREQDRGIEAVATLLFLPPSSPAIVPVPEAAEQSKSTLPQSTSPGTFEFLRLDDLLHAVLSLIDPLLSQRDISVRVILPAPPPILWTNRIALRQLLIMAISWVIRDIDNATLDIMSQPHDQHATLTLTRHDANNRPVLLTQEEEGTLRQLAQDSNVQVNYAGDGGGSVLELLLPISMCQRLLIIDDSLDSIELTRRYLEHSQFELVAVTHAEDALLQAQTLQPSCILLDVMMPGHDGWEILALLKSHPDTIHIPVVVCSVLRNQDLAFALGAAAILPRPHSPSQLIDTLQFAIAQQHPHRAARSL